MIPMQKDRVDIEITASNSAGLLQWLILRDVEVTLGTDVRWINPETGMPCNPFSAEPTIYDAIHQERFTLTTEWKDVD